MVESPYAVLMRITLLLDAKTAARLIRLSDLCDDDLEVIAASILHDVMEDDEAAHQETKNLH
jgi:hypothetical protein